MRGPVGSRPLSVLAPRFDDAACATADTELFFVTHRSAARAKALCAICPVVDACRAWGLEYEEFGIWGGLDELERREIRRALGIRMRWSA